MTTDYESFIAKFDKRRAKTSDDCYTPENIYNAVRDWAIKKFNVKGEVVRPFYPGGDYTKEDYKGKVVIDNPPFSILAKILRFYEEHNVKYFLFAPALTCLQTHKPENHRTIFINHSLTYENGAVVASAFVTNLGAAGIELSHELDCLLHTGKQRKKQERPPHVYTSADFKAKANGNNLFIPNEDFTIVKEKYYGGAIKITGIDPFEKGGQV